MASSRKDEVKAGIVIAVSLLILAGLIVGVSGVSLWERYDRYTVRVHSATGLEPGTPVRLGGLRVGKVLDLRILPEDTSRVEITLGVRLIKTERFFAVSAEVKMSVEFHRILLL